MPSRIDWTKPRLSAFYDETSTVIFGFIVKIIDDRDAAENALLETYNRARRDAARFNSRRQTPIDLLLALARTVAMERKRDAFKHKRKVATFAVNRLSDEQRSILEMTYLGGLTSAEVADSLDVPEQYVKEQIVLALKKLRMSPQNFRHMARFGITLS
jgi:RNA polymerase sigma factor (sigma-70 family)